jgi:hypothetical protein
MSVFTHRVHSNDTLDWIHSLYNQNQNLIQYILYIYRLVQKAINFCTDVVTKVSET